MLCYKNYNLVENIVRFCQKVNVRLKQIQILRLHAVL